MGNIPKLVSALPPVSVKDALANWPERTYTASPADWRDEFFYFLLPDRFSNGKESDVNMLDADLCTTKGVEKIRNIRGKDWHWDTWQKSGSECFQGGTIKGVTSKLGYLKDLGVTTIWLGPIFRQRTELDTYHGYGIQNFLDVDPRFGTRKDLVDLVDNAHSPEFGMRVVLDVIFNHSGCNWLYDASSSNRFQPPYRADGGYEKIWPRNGFGSEIFDPQQQLTKDDYVWPSDLHDYRNYLRAGSGSLGAGDYNDPYAEHKRTDFCDLRKFNLFSDDTFRTLILCYHYWIALADLDGFRIDTFKHVSQDQARNFCNGIKEYAEALGKNDFFLVAEIAGGNSPQARYLDVTGRNLNACLDIGEQRETICGVSKGLQPATWFFGGFDYYNEGMGSHRNYGSKHLSISNDHDHVSGAKLRFSADASNDHQATVAVALQLFSLGIPCMYYGMEQGLASGAEPSERGYLANWGSNDCLLREAMFGPLHPLAHGYEGTLGKLDKSLPGFGPHGTSGMHTFNVQHPIYQRISKLAEARSQYRPLRRGRQYQRETSFLAGPFALHGAGELFAWSRIFDDQEVLVVVNPHGNERRGALITVDGNLSSGTMMVLVNTDPAAPASLRQGKMVKTIGVDNRTCIAIDEWLLGPSEVLLLANASAVKEASRKK